MSALRRRVLGADATGRILVVWEGLSIPWRLASVAMTSVFLAAPVAAAVLLFSSKEWGAKLAGVAAGIAVLYAAYQVRLTRTVAKQTLGYRYFERFGRYSLKEPDAAAKAFALSRPSDKAEEQRRWEQFERWEREDLQKVRDLMFIFNFFEELGGVYKHGTVDRQVINEYLGRFALSFWKGLDWFIPRIRKKRTATLFEDWEAMCQAVERALDTKEHLRKDRVQKSSKSELRVMY
jgi:hypothetical protein